MGSENIITEKKQKVDYRGPLAIMTSLFFVWGLVTVMNNLMMPYMKGVFDLNNTEANLVNFAFFLAYFVMATPASMLLNKTGYHKGIVVGLCLLAFGLLGFYPAGLWISFPAFLFSLFVMGTGVTILQVACNPYISALGDPETASVRVNLAGGFNSLATTIGPIFISFLVLSAAEKATTVAEKAAAVQLPYVGVAIFVFALAFIVNKLNLPKLDIETSSEEKVAGNPWAYRHLVLGVLAIFCYVGAEVSIGTFMIDYIGLNDILALEASDAAFYVSLYWGCLMVGRFIGSAILSKISNEVVLSTAAVMGAILTGFAIVGTGSVAAWSLVGVGLFASVMWGCIFPLGIRDMGKLTGKASGAMIMGVLGGAIIPLIQGYLADVSGIQFSFIVPVVCFAYIFSYAVWGSKVLNK
ncbi:MFS transporter [Fulvitalea axinellae]|uniref:MFS transporter n=1 Tax=Fulvitalea axinellae TaxID=1182444 RepID=A0AAU9CQ93_9BACT|nr:MFS transporter [Fulvitalea axinellae]